MPRVAWESISLPLVALPGASLKDPALVWHDGWFHLVCSAFDRDNHSRLLAWRSRDLAHWDGSRWSLGTGSDGYCSPDIIRDRERFVMTFQSWDAKPPRGSGNQLFYALSDDAAEWDDPRPLAAGLTQGVCAIDAAVARQGDRWYLLYKEAQTPKLATAGHLDGPWCALPSPLSCWAENGQFLQIDGRWRLVATLRDHVQAIGAQHGDPNDPVSWSRWEPFTTIETPVVPGFNRAKPANASSLWDGRQADGHWYRVFCVADEEPERNWGYQLGIARSVDLRTWHLPGLNRAQLR